MAWADWESPRRAAARVTLRSAAMTQNVSGASGAGPKGLRFANDGLMDRQTALRWVRETISAFGGNPDNVFIAGPSSGGNSVMLQVASPSAARDIQHTGAKSVAGVMTRYPAFGTPKPLPAAQAIVIAFAKA